MKKNNKYLHDQFYLQRLEKHDIHSPESVGWSEYLQYRLFEKISVILDDLEDDRSYSLLDVGAGLGDYSSFLDMEKYTNIEYYGIDIIQKMVESASHKYPQKKFYTANFLDNSITRKFDFLISSGSLNVKSNNDDAIHAAYIEKFIFKMYNLANYACSFNLLLKAGKMFFNESDKLFYYADIDHIKSFCDTMADRVEVDYSELDYIFTIRLYKKPFLKDIHNKTLN